MANTESYRFFSVVNAVRMNGQRRVPCVCYPIADSELKEMEKLAAKGVVRLYKSQVRFVSGKAIEIMPESAPTLVVPSEVVVKKDISRSASSRKAAREGSSSVSGEGEFAEENK